MKKGLLKLGMTLALLVIVLSSCKKKTENVASAETETAKKSVNEKETLYLFNWTYYTPDSVLRKFESEFGCKVVVDSFDSNEVMYAKLRNGATGYDITFPSQDYTSIMINQGMLEEIDSEKFTNKKNLNPLLAEKITYDPNMKYSVPYYMGAAGIAVNKLKVKDYEKGWAIFSDKTLAGKMTMMDDMREVLGDALAHLGYSVNTLDSEELKEASDLILDEWKPNLIKFDAEGFGKSFATGDYLVSQGYAEVIYGEVPAEKQDEMIDFFIPSEGGPMYLDSMVILKGSKHYELAMEFINFFHRPEIYAEFLDTFRFPAFVNIEAEKFMKTKPMYEASAMANCELKNDLGEGLDMYSETWENIRF